MRWIPILALLAWAVTPVLPAPVAAGGRDVLEPPGNAACLACHGDASATDAGAAAADGQIDEATYSRSSHGVLSCVRCHAEAGGSDHVADPEAPLGLPAGRAALALYSERCLKCHAGVTRSYRQSFHGIAVQHGDLRAATCVDCHGVHDVFAASDPRSRSHPDRLAATCGAADCHPGAPDGFAAGREHVDVTRPGAGTDQVQHYIWKFFVALILFDVMKDGPIVMFELLRRIRG